MSLLEATAKPYFLQEDGTLIESKDATFGLIDAIKASTPDYRALTDSVRKKLSTAINQQVYLSALKDFNPTITNVKSWISPTNFRVSDKVLATSVTIGSGFHYSKAMNRENSISFQEYVDNTMRKIAHDMAEAKENAIQTVLEAHKTQVLPVNPLAADGFVFNAGTDALDVNLAAQNGMIFNNLRTIFGDNRLKNNNAIISSSMGMEAVLTNMQQYGANNDKNLSQNMPRLFLSNVLTNSAKWTAYWFEAGAFGEVVNFQPDFMERESIPGVSELGVTSYSFPYLNSPVEYIWKKKEADLSAFSTDLANTKVAYIEEMSFFHTFFILTPYNSDISTRVNPVVKIVGATS
jgi:hypothetical protein